MAEDNNTTGLAYDPGAYRYVVAAYIKYMIRARRIDEPEFLTVDELERWELQQDDSETLSKADLLWRAQQILVEEINNRFIARCGSGGVGIDESDLNFTVATFANHLVELPDAILKARANEPIDWHRTAQWDDLDHIRDELDKLPHPSESPIIETATPDVDGYDLEIMWAISKNKLPLTQTQLETRLDMTRKTIGERLKHLRSQGLTVKGSRGEGLTAKGENLLRTHDPKTTQ